MQKERLAIVVPYRNRKEHLKEFLPYMEQYIKDLDYKILIVEQDNNLLFNRAILLNIGFAEAKDYDYFVFHDVDFLPVDGDYSYNKDVTHLPGKIEQYGWKLPYDSYLGGVTMFDKSAFLKINGFSNKFWGWGKEDDELWLRCKYRCLQHDRHINRDLYGENTEYADSLAERFVDGKFTEGYTTLEYTKVSEKKLSEHAVLVKADFKLNKEIKTPQYMIFLKKVRFKLGKYKRMMLGQK